MKKLGPKTLTVVIANYSPMIHAQEPVEHRSVRIELTDAQREALSLRRVGGNPERDEFESVALTFFEPDPVLEFIGESVGGKSDG